MHFGLIMECDYRYGNTLSESFDEAFSVVDAAESGGLDGVWLAERHFAAPRNPLDPTRPISTQPPCRLSTHQRNRTQPAAGVEKRKALR